MHQSFLSETLSSAQTTTLEAPLQLYSHPQEGREPVKILIIGSRPGVNTIVHRLHQLRFAEVFEWTHFLNVPSTLHPQPHEAMKVLIRYLQTQP
ncbi:MAG: hypothetical protein ACFB5Z_14660 [Elainellaceae cyanobacterium]